MAQLTVIWKQFINLWNSLIYSLTWRDALDILIVAILVYQVVKLIRQTRANSVSKGLVVCLAVAWLSGVLQLNTLSWILRQLLDIGLIVVVVLFQPEIRRGLEHVGRSTLKKNLFPLSDKGHTGNGKASEEIINCLLRLSRRKVGALIVIERKTGLSDILASGTRLDAEITAALLENIFEPNTPLHDGAVVIRGSRIESAGCVLPLTENLALSKELGTRHRAAIGISESTDAIVLVASEETGILSMAREGRLTRYLDAKLLSEVLSEAFTPAAQEKESPLARLFKKEAERK